MSMQVWLKLNHHKRMTLENMSMSPKSNQLVPPPNNVSLQVWPNPFTSSEDIAGKRYFGHFKVQL